MTRPHDAAKVARQRHQAPVDPDDMTPAPRPATPETEAIEDDGEPLGGNFA